MGLKESLLIYIEIESSSEYESESKTSTGSALFLYISSLPIPPINSLPSIMSQYDLHTII